MAMPLYRNSWKDVSLQKKAIRVPLQIYSIVVMMTVGWIEVIMNYGIAAGVHLQSRPIMILVRKDGVFRPNWSCLNYGRIIRHGLLMSWDNQDIGSVESHRTQKKSLRCFYLLLAIVALPLGLHMAEANVAIIGHQKHMLDVLLMPATLANITLEQASMGMQKANLSAAFRNEQLQGSPVDVKDAVQMVDLVLEDYCGEPADCIADCNRRWS